MGARTIYYAATSIDGYLATDDHGLDWLLQFDFAEFQPRYDAFLERIGSIVMGARSYEFVLRGGDASWTYGDTPCFVLAHGEHAVPDGSDVRFMEGDVRDVHDAAVTAAAGADVWLLGGGDVAAQFARHDLIDELVVTIVPVLLGSGQRLHPDVSVTTPLTLSHMHRFEGGAVELAYELR